MTPSQVRNDVNQLVTALFQESLAIDGNNAVLLSAAGESLVTWSNDTELSGLFGISTWDEYLQTIRKRWYSVVLWDGAFLQCSYTFRGNDLVKHRLCYFPCPIQFSELEASRLTIEEMMGLLEDKEIRERLRLEGPLRFDYSQDAASDSHPPVHLTISRMTCRVPVSYPLSVGHFARFIFSHFYPEQFERSVQLKSWKCTAWDRCLPDVASDAIYLDWRRGI